MIITIDGPSGTGKSTVARLLAKRLGYFYLDTGATYRAVGLRALEKKIPLTDASGLTTLAKEIRITFKKNVQGQLRVLIDGKDRTRAIRQPRVSEAASCVAVYPGVRRALVLKQRRLGARGGIVAEGRDTGTVVFPYAELKFFLTASSQERARRRFEELSGAGHRVTLNKVHREIHQRDRRDRGRSASPLRQAGRAIRLDNSRLQAHEVVDRILAYVREAQINA